MKQELLCLNSDTVNRYRMVFPITTLEKGMRDTFDTGLPACIGHDRHRPIGLTFPFALYLEPHITRILGKKVTPETREDWEQVYRYHDYSLQKQYREGFKPHEEKFLPLVAMHISENYMRIAGGCAAVHDDGVALKFFPELFHQKDDDDLIPLSTILTDFIYQGQGIFKHRTSDLSIYAHHDFRRAQSIHNNFHFYFLDELLQLADNKDITIKLCLDEDLIGYAPSFHECGELEYHWGPKFTNNISSIKNGITRHECKPFEKAYYGISATEFYWKSDGNEKTFELEELRDKAAPNLDIETYNCRYVHSIFDTTKNSFHHFDGAIRSYSLDEMLTRLDKDFKQAGRNTDYKKLFRIDGKLSVKKWKLLIVHYMQDNPLIYEYFGVAEERELLRIQPRQLDAVQKLLPFAIKKDSGIRLMISYHVPPEDLKQGRYIDIYDVIGTDSESFHCTEHLIYEIKRSLQKLGEDLEIPEDVKLLKCTDRYWNIPSVMHNGPDVADLLSKTIQAYKTLFATMFEKGIDLDITFTLGFIMNDRLIRVSAYGNVESLLNWMTKNLPFPLDEVQFSVWLTKQRKYLEAFPMSSDDPLISSLVQMDGVLYIKRNIVKYPHELIDDENGLAYKIELPEDRNDPIYELVSEQKVEPKLLMIVYEMSWSDTGENYFTSCRSKWLDDYDGAAVNISDCVPLQLYWSRS